MALRSPSGSRRNPAGGAQQSQVLIDAVHESFAQGVARTSLVGGIIMAAGTVIVLVVLPGRRAVGRRRVEESTEVREADRADAV